LGTELKPYEVPHRSAEQLPQSSGVRTSSLRAIGFGPNKFATEAFLDEVAQARGADPVEFRLGLLKNSPRSRRVIEVAARRSGWGQARDGRGLGFAFVDYAGTQVAGVVEVSLDRATGVIRAHNVWVAIDPGLAVQPDNIVAQTEGSVIYGLSLALMERITISDGVVQESNFYDYPVLRLADVPRIEVELVSSDAAPTGVGQMATPLIAPAVSNAVAALVGTRLRHTPMTPDRVLAAL
jgi:isoquinoline 1-oxidoreductase beta subunit